MIWRWDLLCNLIIKNNYKFIVDIGISKGVTVKFIRKSLRERDYRIIKYYGIDPFLEPYYAMDSKVKEKLLNWHAFKLIEKTSDEAIEFIEESIDLVFIDGSHYPEQRIKDITNYFDRLKEGGCMVGHEYMSTLIDPIYGDYMKITEFIDSYIGKENVNYERDRRDESGKPSYLWWTYKINGKPSKELK
jgi:predicted O-methyltransferase YrrM